MRFAFSRRPVIYAVLAACLLLTPGIVPALAQEATPQATISATATTSVYADPAGRFTVEVPTGWTDESADDTGIFVDGHGVTAYLLSVEAPDVESGITAALKQVAPDVTGQPLQTRRVPAPNGVFTQKVYAGPFGLVVVLAQEQDSRVYAEIFRATDEAALQAADLDTFVLSMVVGAPIDLSGQQPAALTPAQLDDFARYAEAQLKRYDIPGASVAVIQNGEVVFAQGFGSKILGGEPVDADTLFMIGSTTKSMTTMMVGALVDDGKLSWDSKVVDLLPTFALSDAALTAQIRVRDLFGNASGVPRYDMPLVLERPTPDEAIASLSAIPLVSPYGEKFNYSNQMVTTGGYVAAIAAGAKVEAAGQDLLDTYVNLMQTRVFDPIGMSRTTLDFDRAAADPNHATSYVRDEIGKTMLAVPLSAEAFAIPFAPSGAVWSSAGDMGRYMQTQLAGGVAPDGTRVVSTENLHETHTPGVSIAGKLSYGMGWMIGDYHGQTMIEHDGGTIGYSADISFLPQANLGVVVLNNEAGTSSFNGALREYVFEQAFGLEHRADAFYWEQQKAIQELTESAMSQLTLDANAPASAKDLLGDYEGHLSLIMDEAGKQLILRTAFGDVPLYAVTNQDGLYVTGGALQGLALQFSSDEDGTTTMTASAAVNIGDNGLPKTYKKLS